MDCILKISAGDKSIVTLKTRTLLFLLSLAAAGMAAAAEREAGVKLLNPPAPPLAHVVEQMRAAGVTAVFQPPSLGINIFSWPNLIRDPEKLEIVRQALTAK